MMIREFIKSVLVEGKIQDLQKKYPNTDVKDVASKDPSPTKKYLEWMIKQLNMGFFMNDIKPTIEFFHQNNQKFQNKDINSYPQLKDLEDKVKEIGSAPSKTKQKNVAKGNAVKFYEDEKMLFVRPDDKASVQSYGANTKWCITMKNATYYEEYTDNNVIFYFLIDKTADPKDDWSKVAIACERDEDNEIRATEFFNTIDDSVTEDEVSEKFKGADSRKVYGFILKAQNDAVTRPQSWGAKLNSSIRTAEFIADQQIVMAKRVKFAKDFDSFDAEDDDYLVELKQASSKPYMNDEKAIAIWSQMVTNRTKSTISTEQEEKFLAFMSYRQQKNVLSKIDSELEQIIDSGGWYALSNTLFPVRRQLDDTNGYVSAYERWKRNDDKIFITMIDGNDVLKVEALSGDGEVDFIRLGQDRRKDSNHKNYAISKLNQKHTYEMISDEEAKQIRIDNQKLEF